MTQRLNYPKLAPAIFSAMRAVEARLDQSSLASSLVHLMKLRASQINGCAFCIDMHWKDLRALGETEQRLYGLGAWEEAPYYTDAERAALAWTEAVTRIHEGHAPDHLFDALRTHFTEEQIVELTWAIAAINAWNRIAIGFRQTAGSYVSASKDGINGARESS